MLFRENAIKAAQQPLIAAQKLLTEPVKQYPLDNLDTLVIISNLVEQSKRSYAQSEIGAVKDPLLSDFDDFIAGLTPLLVGHAKALLSRVVDRTLQLRKQIEEAKTNPILPEIPTFKVWWSFSVSNITKRLKTVV